MTARFLVWLIACYQRYLSPHKGFHCAHHRLHQGDTCSNATKQLLLEHGAYKALPKIKARFSECRSAYHQLTTLPSADLPCDIACDPGILDCGSGGSASGKGCVSPCEFIFDWSTASKKTRRRVMVAVISSLLTSSYWFYGRAVSAVYLADSGGTPSLLQKFTERGSPKFRVMLQAGGKKFYSETVAATGSDEPLRLNFSSGPTAYHIENLEVHDARLQLGGKLFVLGQVLEEHSNPASRGQGARFSYRIKRRWHFW